MSEWKRISSLAHVRRGASPRPIGDPSYFGGDVGWVRISDVTRSSRFLRETEQYVSPLGESLSVRVNPGDLVMSICGTLGRPIVIDIPACIHDGFVQFTNLKDVDSVYLFYALQFSESKFNGMGQPGTQTNLNTTLVGRLEIFAPPIETQRRIATILTTLDEVIEATEKLVEKHQQIKAGLMHDLFTRGLWTHPELARGDHKGTPAEATAHEGQLRPTPEEAPGLYQDSPLGLIPKEWKVKNCSHICEKITVGIVIRPTQYYVPESGVPAFRSANIKETGIDMNDLVFISDFSNSLLAKSQVKAGDVLSVRTGYPGTSAVVPEELEGCNCIDILISRPTSEIASQFLCDWINSSFGRGQVLRKQGGLAQQHFNVGDLRNLQVVIPSDTEQTEIGLRLASATENIATENTHLAKLRQQKQGLMHDLLTGRVRVNRTADSKSKQ